MSFLIPEAVADALEAGVPAFKAFRIFADRSIPELADAAHMEPRRLADIEAGCHPRPDEVTALGLALRVPTRLLTRR